MYTYQLTRCRAEVDRPYGSEAQRGWPHKSLIVPDLLSYEAPRIVPAKRELLDPNRGPKIWGIRARISTGAALNTVDVNSPIVDKSCPCGRAFGKLPGGMHQAPRIAVITSRSMRREAKEGRQTHVRYQLKTVKLQVEAGNNFKGHLTKKAERLIVSVRNLQSKARGRPVTNGDRSLSGLRKRSLSRSSQAAGRTD